MPGNCGTEARSFRNSTDWFREESYFSIAAASTVQTERAVKTRTCLCQSCHAFGFYCRFSRDVTKIQATKLMILLIFYFNEA